MGCILFQLVTGRVPFEAENFMGVLSLHLTQPPPIVPAEVLDLIGAPRALAGVIDQALAKDRNHRFSSIDELARAVRRASGDKLTGPVVVPPSVQAPPTTQHPTRNKTEWTGNLSIPEIDPGGQARKSKLPIILAAVGLGAAAIAVVAVVASRGAPTPVAMPTAPAAPVAAPTIPVPPRAPAVPPVAAPVADAPLTFERAQIRLDSAPTGAEVRDLTSNAVIGRTPFSFTVPASRNARRFALHRKDYLDAVVELIPDRPEIKYSEKLERGKSIPGVAPVVSRPTAPSAPQTPATPALQAPPLQAPPVAPTTPAVTPPAPPAPPPAAPAKPDDDCGDPPCLKADPSRSKTTP
jgi:serine/threonine-protein kinase